MIYRILITVIIFNCLILPVFAQSGSMAFSITPPLINNNVVPGQLWKSTITVINNNTEEISVYVKAVDFEGSGENGTVTFIEPDGSEGETDYLLSRWIDLPKESITIPPLKSHEVPFIVAVPESAAPGGHYAAILVGTKPPEEKASGASIKISSLIASLIMLNVSGAVVESGQIREFSTNKSVYGQGEVAFKVRFENLGNVHVQPQGEIRVYDMWGKSAAGIKINHSTDFGNVLPGDIRGWDFDWHQDIGLAGMGRYRAELILSYGNKTKETLAQTRYFWIFLFKPLAMIVGGILLLLFLVYVLVRRSVRKAIRETEKMAGIVYPDSYPDPKVTVLPREIRENGEVVVNLKNKQTGALSFAGSGLGWRTFKRTVVSVLGAALVIGAGLAYKMFWPDLSWQAEDAPEASNYEDYKAGLIGPDSGSDSATSGPKIMEDDSQPGTTTAEADEALAGQADETIIGLSVLNGSGAPGAAKKAEELLLQAGFEVAKTGNADNFNYQTTLVRYSPGSEAAARLIKELFAKPIELELVEDMEGITVIVGKDF